MKKILLFFLLIDSYAALAQATGKDCTEETILYEPGTFLDAHTGKGLSSTGYAPSEIANIRKILSAIEGVCKKNLVFTGGQAKASFMLHTKGFYNQLRTNQCTYNLGFHAFVCNVQTHKLRVVPEYQNVLRVTVNPDFQKAFDLDVNSPAFRVPVNSASIASPPIKIYGYYAFADKRIPDAINNGNDFMEVSDENISPNTLFAENRPGTGYGFVLGTNFDRVGGSTYIYRHRYLTHTDIPFLIPVSRKQFLQDLLEFYEREKAYLIVETPSGKSEIIEANEKKKAFAQNLLSTKNEKWLSGPAAIEKEGKSFTTYDAISKRNRSSIWGRFYFTDFYNGNDGLKLYCVNPEYIKKYPPAGARPSVIKIMYRFRVTQPFGNKVNDDYIKKLDIEGLRALL